MLSRSVRLGTPWTPGWKRQALPAPVLGQLVAPTSGPGDWWQSTAIKAVGAGMGAVVATTLGSLARLIIPSLRRQSKITRTPNLIGGGALVLIGTLAPLKGGALSMITTVGGVLLGIGASGFIVPPKGKPKKA